ncbi:MAG: rhamnulokinase [Planctomycetales bacterium]|nr:rhamnulokinase [Planctomycetales bacterium]
MAEQVFLAADLGASSGRLIAGRFDGNRLTMEAMHRFSNGGVPVGDRLLWNILGLWGSLLEGLRAAHAKFGDSPVSIGVDAWGVDFAMLGRNDTLLGSPYHYRDHHTDGVLEEAFEVVPRDQIFAETGLQFMQFNSLYQLWRMRQANDPILEAAETFLMIPDLMNWLFCGSKCNELTDASTTQLYNPQTKAWSSKLIEAFGLPSKIFGSLAAPGTNLGVIRGPVAAETGVAGLRVVLPGAHDTASAVMSVPAIGELSNQPNWCYISSGTWSLMGVETADPIVTDACLQRNFTNEAGVGGATRVLKNICGLWLVQECRRRWSLAGRDYDWNDLSRAAAAASPLVSLIDPDAPEFMGPEDMPSEIAKFCRASGQPTPSDDAAMIRCCLEGLALRYRQVLGWLEELIGGRIETIHVVGGGSLNALLCQMTADACGRVVVAGPVEATAVGNIMMQAVAAGAVADISQAREVVRQSFDSTTYTPSVDRAAWDEAFGRFVELTASNG